MKKGVGQPGKEDRPEDDPHPVEQFPQGSGDRDRDRDQEGDHQNCLDDHESAVRRREDGDARRQVPGASTIPGGQ